MLLVDIFWLLDVRLSSNPTLKSLLSNIIKELLARLVPCSSLSLAHVTRLTHLSV